MKVKRTTAAATALLVMAMVALGCGEDDGEAVVESPTTTTTEATNAAAGDADETDEADEGGSGTAGQRLEVPMAEGDRMSVTVSSLGGIRFEHPADMTFVNLDDGFSVFPNGQGANEGNAHVGLVTQLGSGAEVSTLAEYLAAVEVTHEIEPTGNTVQVGEWELAEYFLEGSDGTFTFGTSRFPAPVQAGTGPFAFARVFVAETPSGILEMGVGGPAPESIDEFEPVLGLLIESLEFTGPGLDPALPPGEVIETADAGPPPDPAEAPADATFPALGAPFAPADPGRHELLNFGVPVSVDFGDGWFVQPNFPGVVILTHPESIGPNDRDIVFINSISEFAPIAAGPVRAGDAVAVDDIEALIAAPPAGVTISEVDRFALVADSGSTMPVVAFDVDVSDTTACSPTDPCEFAFITSYGFVKPLRNIDVHRIWWFPEHPTGPAAAVAAANVAFAPWLDDAEALMATLELSR